MKTNSTLVLLTTLLLAAANSSCTKGSLGGRKKSHPPYIVKALRPSDPSKVEVKVSLSKKHVYVMEGDKLLMVAATCIGTPQNPTPRGNFTIIGKEEQKRSHFYGFFVNGDSILPGETRKPQPGRFVGYPLGYWCEFKPGYGFHSGYVHPDPRTHGCLRLHKSVAPKLFTLVRQGTPVSIKETQPEDDLHGVHVQKPMDYLDDDPPESFMISAQVFEKPQGPLLE
jgi:hypothetical protein